MNHPSSGTNRPPVPFMALAPFLFMTFGVAWGIFALFILWSEWMVATFGEVSGQHPHEGYPVVGMGKVGGRIH